MIPQQKVVLIIEDDPLIRTSWTILLAKTPYKIIQQSDSIMGEDALRTQKIDIVILDLNLPPEGNRAGFDILKSKLKIPDAKDVPVVIVTGIMTMDKLIEITKGRKDIVEIYEKPLDNDLLIKTITRILGE